MVSFTIPAFREELSELVREGTQRIVRKAVEAELGAFLEKHTACRDARGRRPVLLAATLRDTGGVDGNQPVAGPGSPDAGQDRSEPVFSPLHRLQRYPAQAERGARRIPPVPDVSGVSVEAARRRRIVRARIRHEDSALGMV